MFAVMDRLREAWRRFWAPREDPRNPAHELVELTSSTRRFDVDVIAAKLRAEGIQCAVFYADAGGWRPELGLVQGHRVMVRAEDVTRAREATEPEP